eukprot:scaffold3165_cov85-Cylindrotheca_fusiformis.AAC.1
MQQQWNGMDLHQHIWVRQMCGAGRLGRMCGGEGDELGDFCSGAEERGTEMREIDSDEGNIGSNSIFDADEFSIT